MRMQIYNVRIDPQHTYTHIKPPPDGCLNPEWILQFPQSNRILLAVKARKRHEFVLALHSGRQKKYETTVDGASPVERENNAKQQFGFYAEGSVRPTGRSRAALTARSLFDQRWSVNVCTHGWKWKLQSKSDCFRWIREGLACFSGSGAGCPEEILFRDAARPFSFSRRVLSGAGFIVCELGRDVNGCVITRELLNAGFKLFLLFV